MTDFATPPIALPEPRLTRLLDDALTACCRDLFHAYGMDLEPKDDAPAHHAQDLGAAMGFGGDQIKGSLVLFTTSRMATSVYPVAAADGAASHAMLLDWVAELANQLVGRIKLRLLGEGVELRLSTPVALSGQKLEHSSPRADLTRSATLGGPAGQVQLWLDVVVRPGFELSEVTPRTPIEPAVDAGSLLLF